MPALQFPSKFSKCLIFVLGGLQALKNRDERYTLIWPEKAEFVRMAARFGAIIVPFSAVGVEDGLNQVGSGGGVKLG